MTWTTSGSLRPGMWNQRWQDQNHTGEAGGHGTHPRREESSSSGQLAGDTAGDASLRLPNAPLPCPELAELPGGW